MSKKDELVGDRLHEALEDAWLHIPYSSEQLYNPLETIPENFHDEPHLFILWMLTNPEYFSLFCKEILNITILPFQCVILHEMWVRKFPILIGCRGLGKSFLLALYSILRMVFMPGRKIVITGAGFRQSKIIFEYMEKIWYNAPLLRDIVGDTNTDRNGPVHGMDMWRFVINESCAVAIPIGTGEKIRGQRAHDILVDEFAVGSAEIFEHVISGFAAVSSNPVLNVMKTAKRKRAEELNVILPREDENLHQANQIILSGTAYYSFNHFFKYWNLWRGIINSQGDKKLLRELGIEDALNWRDYSVIRIPYELMPEGFMEEAIVSRSRSSMHSSLFQMEFSGCFGDDSNGFFSRRLIEKCVDEHSILMEGIPGHEYVIAVDPASENDNFCIVIIEVSKLTRRVVYCWTTTKRLYKEELKSGRAKEDDFYDYAARKILTLVNKFNVIGIAIDSQGGGHAIMDRLHSEKVVKKDDGEVPLWKFIDKDKPIDEDGEDGRHIIESVSFADAEYTGMANHGMRLDFEIHALLFPGFDSLTFAEIDLSIDKGIKFSDMMEEAVVEIEELKNELASIVMSQTFNGRDKWDTPDEKLAGAKKGRLRKDRYSALLMANALGKKLFNIKPTADYNYTGGFAGTVKREEDPKIMFTGSALAKKFNEFYREM